MKNKKLILPITILGFLVLFFFPNPETNFLYYLLTLLVFVILVVLILIKSKK